MILLAGELGILGIIIGLLVLIAIYATSAAASIFTVGGIILAVIALGVGIPAALVFYAFISGG